jgi:hypothetical protein
VSVAVLFIGACQGPEEYFRDAGTISTPGTGNTVGSAGTTGTGNTVGTAGTGGGVVGVAGTTGTGNTVGAAGTTGTAGTTGAGGSTGGRGGTTGMAGTGGTTGSGGGTGTNCVDTIKVNGYSAPGAPPCSACMENGMSRETLCTKMIDCLDAMYPCTGNCYSQCSNTAGLSGPSAACVSALLTAGNCQ